MKLLSRKSDCQLYASLYIANQAEQADLDEFFAHKNHAYPMSLSEYGKLRKTGKYEFLNCLEEIQEPSYDGPHDMEMIVIYGVVLVYLNPPKHSRTFGEYRESELGEQLERLAVPVSQLNLVFDVYSEDSLKAETQEGRENGARVSVKDSTPIHSNFKKFFSHNDNETELFLLIADEVPKFTQNISATVICTKLSDVTSDSENDLSLCFPATRRNRNWNIRSPQSCSSKWYKTCPDQDC